MTDLASGSDEAFPVQLFFLLATYNPSYILFIGHKLLFVEKYGIFQSRAV